MAPLHSSLGNRARPGLSLSHTHTKEKKLKNEFGPGVVVCACNPSTLGGIGRRRSGVQDQPGQHREAPSLKINNNVKLGVVVRVSGVAARVCGHSYSGG